MTDICKCSNIGCPSHQECWRFVCPGSEYQAYADFKPQEGEDKCEYFIEAAEWQKWSKK